MKYHVGDEVVCAIPSNDRGLLFGNTYTVREYWVNNEGWEYVYLEGFGGSCFNVKRFCLVGTPFYMNLKEDV